MTSFVSKSENEFKAMEYGTVYYMDVVLKNRNVVMTEGYISDAQYGLGDSGYEKYYLKQRGSIYGYPLSSQVLQTSSADEEHIRDLRDPHYGQWTPPYFYGDAVARISFAPHEFDTTMSPGESRKFALDEILRGSKIRTYKKTRIGGEDGNSNFVPSWDDDVGAQNGLYNTLNYSEYNIETVDSGTYGEFASTILFTDMMTIDSSVNLWGKKKNPVVDYSKINTGSDDSTKSNIGVNESTNGNNESWVISTKWETPILQFSGHGIDTYCSLPDATSKDLSEVRRARGMWYDYGVLPSNDDGIYLEIKESFPERVYDKKVYADSEDTYTSTNLTTFKTYSGQDVNFRHSVNNELYGSLVDVCGFKVGESRIGEIADSGELREAVCVIPFIEQDGEIKFFDVDKAIFDKQKENVFTKGYSWKMKNGDIIKRTSIMDTYDKMKDFVLPPQFDYRRYDDINPFIMYILDTKFDLSKQDLVDIWQNVMPDSFKVMKKDHIEFEHELEKYEFFHGQEIPSDIRFMMFKIKKKAEWNYYNVLPSSNEESKFKFEIMGENGEYVEKEPTFNYNYPYDFISVIAAARFDVSFELEEDNMEFFDSKSEVIDFQLTRYGSKLLRDGKLEPVYYAFYDDAIVYDGEYAGKTEEQNDIEDRIFHDTPYIHTISKAGSKVKKIIDDDFDIQVIDSIGKSSTFNAQDDVPRWKIRSINSEFDGDNIEETPLDTSQERVVMNIPQIPYEEIEYEWEPVYEVPSNESEIEPSDIAYRFDDGTGIRLIDDYILLDVQELGVDFLKHNFDVDIYEIQEGTGRDGESNYLKQLYFFKKPQLIKDGVLLDDDKIIEYDDDMIAEDSSLVEHHFEVLFDHEIPDEYICEYLSKENDNNNIYLRDSGVFNVESDNRSCKVDNKNSVYNQYDVRTEDNIGNEC